MESEAIRGGEFPYPPFCQCPGDREPGCHCLPPVDDQALTTSAVSPAMTDIQVHPHCKINSDCNGVCPKTCKYKVCTYNRSYDRNTCHCYVC